MASLSISASLLSSIAQFLFQQITVERFAVEQISKRPTGCTAPLFQWPAKPAYRMRSRSLVFAFPLSLASVGKPTNHRASRARGVCVTFRTRCRYTNTRAFDLCRPVDGTHNAIHQILTIAPSPLADAALRSPTFQRSPC
ncbi:hypothetical protein BDN71DRAFT_1284498 [Pleurotus eryngii]|uniref:Secreted protein n=1 Tax=Pleurotus eryngii TaxID=5323 RepID=A0A9P5ZPR2_PLEER|nr:hypothetical protein BDN71DRAFT_1284498 [Pleurotus eryngii]